MFSVAILLTGSGRAALLSVVVFFLWRWWVYGIAFLLLGFVLAGSWRRAMVLTDAELTELRCRLGENRNLRAGRPAHG